MLMAKKCPVGKSGCDFLSKVEYGKISQDYLVISRGLGNHYLSPSLSLKLAIMLVVSMHIGSASHSVWNANTDNHQSRWQCCCVQIGDCNVCGCGASRTVVRTDGRRTGKSGERVPARETT